MCGGREGNSSPDSAQIAAASVPEPSFQWRERFETGNAAGGDGSCLKLLATELQEDTVDLVQEAAGPLRAVKVPSAGSDARVDFSEMYLQ